MINLAKSFFGMFAATTIDPLNPRDPQLARMFGQGSMTDAGISVTNEKVLGLPAVKRAIEIIANGMMNKKWCVVKETDKGDEPQKDHRFNKTIHKANPNLLFSDWVFTMQSWACLFGNAVSIIDTNSEGNFEFYPVLPTKTRLALVGGSQIKDLLGKDFQLMYETDIAGKKVYKLPGSVIHIQGFSANGYWGYNLVDLFKETFGGAIAPRKHGQKTFGQGGLTKGFVTMPDGLTDEEAKENFRDSLQKVTGGLDNAQKIVLLENNAKFQPWGQTNEETQFLEKLEFDNTDLANVMGIQAAKVGVRKEQSFNSLEMAEQEHDKDDMQSWNTKWEDELSDKSLTPEEYEAGYRVKAEDKTNWIPFKDKATAAKTLYHGGIGSKNESRKLVNLPPVDEEDNDFLRPANILPADTEEIDPNKESKDTKYEAAVKSMLTHTIGRLGKQASKKVSNIGGFISWVGELQEEQGPEFSRDQMKSMVSEFKTTLLEFTDTISGKSEFESAVSAYLESAEKELPEKHFAEAKE